MEDASKSEAFHEILWVKTADQIEMISDSLSKIFPLLNSSYPLTQTLESPFIDKIDVEDCYTTEKEKKELS